MAQKLDTQHEKYPTKYKKKIAIPFAVQLPQTILRSSHRFPVVIKFSSYFLYDMRTTADRVTLYYASYTSNFPELAQVLGHTISVLIFYTIHKSLYANN